MWDLCINLIFMDYKFQPIVITFYTISLFKISNKILSGNNALRQTILLRSLLI